VQAGVGGGFATKAIAALGEVLQFHIGQVKNLPLHVLLIG
jgi:hypothetical protein